MPLYPYVKESRSDQLHNEIISGGLTPDFVNFTAPDDTSIYFDVALSSGDELILDAIVAAHVPDPYYNENAATDFIELDLQLINGTIARYKEFTYTLGDITKMEIYTDNTKITKLFTVDYTYTGDNITSVTVTREIDSATYTKTFSYDGDGNVTSVDIL